MGLRVGIVGRIVIALVAVAGVATGSSIYLMYRTHLDRQQEHLRELAGIVSTLVASIAEFDRDFGAGDQPDGALGATIDQVRHAFSSTPAFHDTAEILIVRDGGGPDLELLAHQFLGQETNRDGHKDIPRGSTYGAAIKAGFEGASGTAQFENGETGEILVAFAPVHGTDLLTITELPLSQVNDPFFHAAMIAVLVAIAVGMAGTLVARKEAVSVVQALDGERKKLRDFAESASDWFWEQNEEFEYVSVDESARPHTPLRAEQVLGKRREDSADEDTNTEKWQRLRERLRNHEPFKNFVYRAVSEDGQRVALSASGVPVFDSNGRFRGYRGTAADVTDRLDKAQKLSDAEEKSRVAFESMTVGVIEISSDGCIKAFNPKAEEMFGYHTEEVIGKNVSILMPQPHAHEHDGHLKRFIETGEEKVIGIGRELTGLTKDGIEIPIHLGVAEMKLGDERHFVGALTDLRTQKTLETMLRRSNKLDAIGQLSGGIAHDFNNLLGIVLGNLELMQRKLEPDSRLFQQVDKAIDAARRGAGLTRKLLDFSRQAPEAQQHDIVDTTEVISGLTDLIGRSLSANIEVKTAFAEDVLPVKCDRSDLEDAIVNLVMNAKDAMPKGGSVLLGVSSLTVDLADNLAMVGLAPGRYTEINISDSGCGMSRETLDRIFDPFFTTKQVGKGTGLGLPMVYGFAKRSGGHVLAYSEEGLGSTFKLYLPCAGEADGGVTAKNRGDHEIEVHGGTETVLVVDDEEGLLDIARNVLQEYGYTVHIAASPSTALEILKKDDRVDLIFSDFIMPGEMNGIELIEKSLEARPRLKALLTSGFTGQALKPEEAERWAAHLIAKPYSNRALAKAVRAVLDEGGVS